MSISISVLSSGSKGNATFIRAGRVGLLIDCGLGLRALQKRLHAIGENESSIDAVLVTHEHTDHVRGLRSMLKASSLESFMTGGTIDGSHADSFDLNASAIIPVIPGQTFTIADVEVDTFSVPHDAEEPVGFSIRHEGIKVTQLTDLGWIPDDVADAMKGSDVLILESNHDLDMLRMGTYPWNLKERLMGRKGHLSNSAVAQFLSGAYDGQAQNLILAHLSSKNNYPEIARLEACNALESRGLDSSCVSVALQAEPTARIELG